MRKGDSFVNLQKLLKSLCITGLAMGFLHGCNLKIVAPLSGSVVSDSGMYVCQAGETCTIGQDGHFCVDGSICEETKCKLKGTLTSYVLI